jgi:hypothetical protein
VAPLLPPSHCKNVCRPSHQRYVLIFVKLVLVCNMIKGIG